MKLATLFISNNRRIFTKVLTVSESSIKILRLMSHMDIFCNFSYFIIYLQTKSFALKRDCAISSKLQML